MTVALGALLEEVADDDGPGVAVGIYRDGALVSASARGLACLEHAVAIGSRTRFDLASVSKQLTGTCALLLHREGLVDLDADPRTRLPELGQDGLTLRGCLHHTTGLPDCEEVTRLRGEPLARLAALPQFLDWVRGIDRTQFPPGTDIAYSNTGYVLVAAALSRAAGQPFAELMRDRVLSPLAMNETVVRDTVGLLEPGPLRDGRPTRYGCGVAHRTVVGHDVLFHLGSMYGYRSCLVSVPGEGLGVTVLANRGDLDAQTLALDVLRRCLAGADGRLVPAAQPGVDRGAPLDSHVEDWLGHRACRLVAGSGAYRLSPGRARSVSGD